MKTDGKYLLEPVPHEQAMAFIKDKPVVSREAFNHLLPELKARAFTITGVESANVSRKIRDRVADLPAGANWDDIKGDILKDLSPWLVDENADAETRDAQIAAADRRAELLLRTHGFQAYQATQHDVMTRQKEVFPYWQYMTMEDEAVRESHAALDGLILPADSPFWSDHYPPWDWGCRCQVVSLLADEEQEVAAGESDYGFVLSEAQTKLLETAGMLDLGDAQPVNVASPTAMGKEGAFSWDPGSLRIPIDQLKDRYDPEVWNTFQTWADKQALDDNGVTVMDWLKGAKVTGAPIGADIFPPAKAAVAVKPPAATAPAPQPVAVLPTEKTPATPKASAVLPPAKPATAPKVSGQKAPVSDALNVRVWGKLKEQVQHALSVIDKVHDDGKLPRITITPSKSNASGYGAYESLGRTAAGIRVRNHGPWPALTTVHEVGHFLDQQALGTPGELASELSKDLREWRDAVNASHAVELLRNGQIMGKIKKDFVSEPELFARSYAQYIAQKSEDPELLKDLDRSRKGNESMRQWQDDDFKPIHAALDNLFKKKGWL